MKYYAISLLEMHNYLSSLQFQPILLPCKEKVYGKIIDKNVCLRIYTGIVNNESRECGEDAIRLCLVKRMSDGKVKGIMKTARVYRVEGWQHNLSKRVETIIEEYQQRQQRYVAIHN